MSIDVTVVSNGGQVIEVSVGEGAGILDALDTISEDLATKVDAGGAAGAAPVQSVAGKTGAVALAKSDVGLGNADNTSDADKPISTAQAAALATKTNTAQAAAAAPVQSVAGKTGTVSLSKGDVGLGSVDNTSDASKPVSTAQAAADTAARDAAISTLKGTADSSSDTLGKLAGRVDGVKLTADTLATVTEVTPAAPVYAEALLDEDDYDAGGYRADGVFAPALLAPPPECIDNDALAPDIRARIFTGPLGDSFDAAPDGSGVTGAHLDEDDYLSYHVDDSGKHWFGDIGLPDHVVEEIADTASSSVQADIGIELLPEGSPYSYVFLDEDDFMSEARDASGNDVLGGDSAKLGTDQLLEDANYLIVPSLDVDGNQQIRAQSKTSGNKLLLTPAGEDARAPTLASGYLTYRSGNIYRRIPVTGGSARQITTTPDTTFIFGDSLSDNFGNAPPFWNYAAMQRPGSVWSGQGTSGQGSLAIGARQGSRPAKLTLTSNTIPASGAVTVTALSVRLLTSTAYSTPQAMAGTLETPTGSIHGVLYKDASDVYTFTRSVAGAPIACPAQTAFIPDIALQAKKARVILWEGRNDGTTNFPTITQPAILDAYAYMEPLIPEMLIYGVTTMGDGSENPGTAAYTNIVAHAAWVTNQFGPITFGSDHTVNNAIGRGVDIRRIMIDHGLYFAGLSATSDDLTDIANDMMPRSLMRPISAEPARLHFGTYGNLAGGRILDLIYNAKGW